MPRTRHGALRAPAMHEACRVRCRCAAEPRRGSALLFLALIWTALCCVDARVLSSSPTTTLSFVGRRSLPGESRVRPRAMHEETMSVNEISLWKVVLLASAAVLLGAAARSQSSQLPELAWTERSDWINVKTDVSPAAVGNGLANDTLAIQTALDAAFNGDTKGTTIYFPPGTYRITATVNLEGGTSRFGVNLVGHGRTTSIIWDGATGGNMLKINGNPYGRYTGLTLDGQDRAASGFYHYNTNGWFETSIRYKHVRLTHINGDGIFAVPNDA